MVKIKASPLLQLLALVGSHSQTFVTITFAVYNAGKDVCFFDRLKVVDKGGLTYQTN